MYDMYPHTFDAKPVMTQPRTLYTERGSQGLGHEGYGEHFDVSKAKPSVQPAAAVQVEQSPAPGVAEAQAAVQAAFNSVEEE